MNFLFLYLIFCTLLNAYPTHMDLLCVIRTRTRTRTNQQPMQNGYITRHRYAVDNLTRKVLKEWLTPKDNIKMEADNATIVLMPGTLTAF